MLMARLNPWLVQCDDVRLRAGAVGPQRRPRAFAVCFLRKRAPGDGFSHLLWTQAFT
jgi:hypothetical protein